MLKKLRLLFLFFLSLMAVACTTLEEKTNDEPIKNEPGYLDLIICSEPGAKS
jgi:hypothetical protein